MATTATRQEAGLVRTERRESRERNVPVAAATGICPSGIFCIWKREYEGYTQCKSSQMLPYSCNNTMPWKEYALAHRLNAYSVSHTAKRQTILRISELNNTWKNSKMDWDGIIHAAQNLHHNVPCIAHAISFMHYHSIRAARMRCVLSEWDQIRLHSTMEIKSGWKNWLWKYEAGGALSFIASNRTFALWKLHTIAIATVIRNMHATQRARWVVHECSVCAMRYPRLCRPHRRRLSFETELTTSSLLHTATHAQIERSVIYGEVKCGRQ